MSEITFTMQNPEDTDKWLETLDQKMKGTDFNHVASMALSLRYMEDFIFNDKIRSKDFFAYMKEIKAYQPDMH